MSWKYIIEITWNVTEDYSDIFGRYHLTILCKKYNYMYQHNPRFHQRSLVLEKSMGKFNHSARVEVLSFHPYQKTFSGDRKTFSLYYGLDCMIGLSSDG